MKIKTAVFFILFGFISLTGQETGKLRKVVFNTSWLPQAQFAGYFVARDKGFYEKYGLKTDFIFGSYDFGVEQNLTEGKADLGIMWLHEGILAHEKNKSIVNIAQFFDSSNIEIVSRSENISSIGVWKPFVKFLSTYIHEEISDSIEIVPLRNGIESFVLGAVDAITVTNYNELNQLINSGIDADELHIYKLAGMGLVLPEDGIYCLRDFYNNNEKLCDDFIKASLEGWQYAFNNIDEAVDICFNYIDKTNYKSNRTIQKLMLNTIKNQMNENEFDIESLNLQKSSFEKVMKYLLRKELISDEIDYEQFYEGQDK